MSSRVVIIIFLSQFEGFMCIHTYISDFPFKKTTNAQNPSEFGHAICSVL